ncbi:LysR family transcriptional regulator [Oceanospirillum sediminis]|uniref:LysR family transcriptional regulator n=1 Tax=Oceanospirillum sediminis TaxID=2760088 RepID=A0A839IW44_9GAMM|nr:LysR family transcriptional regulator [Oceanospirillum sediminis]MBB1488982.1 LysR family transcriptional regulator [Oceanospirillum sediminis]
MLKDLNMKHLYYFWVIAETGSIARASEYLDLTPQTLSGQLSAFEACYGTLFTRNGRNLKLNSTGEQVRQYASQIFTMAGELDQFLNRPREALPLNLNIGICSSVHKLIAYRLIAPATEHSTEVHLKVVSGHQPDLIRSLQSQQLDIIISDRLPEEQNQSLFFTPLLSSALSLFATRELADQLTDNFPKSLNDQPLLANDTDTPWFYELMNWLKKHNIRTQVCAEISDSALIKIFAQQGKGIFAAPTAIRDEVCHQYGVQEIGETCEVFTQHYAITRTPDPIHPAIQCILKQARTEPYT